jgi:TonB family protein
MTKVAIYLAAFYLVYTFLLSRDTLYQRNRIFILFSVLSALMLPLITIEINKPLGLPIFGKMLSDVLVTGSKGGKILGGSDSIEFNICGILSLIYLAGLIFFGLRLFVDLFELILLIINQKDPETHIIRFNGFRTAGFSAMGKVFINSRLAPKEADEIIRHEQNHLDHYHFLDIVFVEIVKVFQWFNPFIHLFNKSLRAVHEFQADEGCLKAGIPVVSYQNLLLNQVFMSKIFGLTNCFSNPTLIKTRMIMMTKKRSGTLANLKLLLAMPVTASVMVAFSSCGEKQKSEIFNDQTVTVPDINNQNISTNSKTAGLSNQIFPPPPPPPPPSTTSDKSTVKKYLNDPEPFVIVEENQLSPSAKELKVEPFDVVDEMPVFPGGGEALIKYIKDNVNYPESAKTRNIQGKVVARFVISTDGNVSRASIIKSVSPELDGEALRVIKTLPKFKPGKQDGQSVPVWFMVPITFYLK